MLKSRLVTWRRQIRGIVDTSIRYNDNPLHSLNDNTLTDQYTNNNGLGFFINDEHEVLGVIPMLIKHFTPDVNFVEYKVAS